MQKAWALQHFYLSLQQFETTHFISYKINFEVYSEYSCVLPNHCRWNWDEMICARGAWISTWLEELLYFLVSFAFFVPVSRIIILSKIKLAWIKLLLDFYAHLFQPQFEFDLDDLDFVVVFVVVVVTVVVFVDFVVVFSALPE